MHHLLFLTICFIWGSSFILMKRASESFGAVTIGAGRVFGGAIILMIIWGVKRDGWSIKREHCKHIFLVVLIAYLWPFTIQPYLVSKHGGAFVGMMVALVPLLTVILSVPMLKIYPSGRQAIGVLGGLACLLVLMNEGMRRSIPLPDMLMIASVPAAYALGNTYIKRHLTGIPPLALSCVCLGLASVLLLPTSQFVFAEQIKEGGDIVMAAQCLAVLGLICTGMATYIFYTLIQKRGPLFASMVAYLVPVGAMMWGWWDSEQISATQVICLCGVMLMVALVQTDRSGLSSHPSGELVKPDLN
jgi:drug/metabolite transporter (DMT)-like permease